MRGVKRRYFQRNKRENGGKGMNLLDMSENYNDKISKQGQITHNRREYLE